MRIQGLIRVEIRRINVCAHFNRLAVSQQDDVAEAVVVHMVAGQILFCAVRRNKVPYFPHRRCAGNQHISRRKHPHQHHADLIGVCFIVQNPMMGKFQHIYVANEVLVLAVDVAAGGVIAGKQHPLLPINQHKIQRIHVLIAVVLHRFRPDAVHR
ncbi:MAG: hypothetical protein V8R10_03810 [Christensenellales bacterium]